MEYYYFLCSKWKCLEVNGSTEEVKWSIITSSVLPFTSLFQMQLLKRHARDMHLLRMSKSMLVACAQRTDVQLLMYIRATRAPGDPLPATQHAGFTKGSLHGSSAT